MFARSLPFAFLCAFVLPAQAAPNILFLVADDLNCDLGCYGSEGITPHIDRLAARGVRFERAYCQAPLCSPSRQSFLTGRRPNATGVIRNPPHNGVPSPHFRETLPDAITLPQFFRKKGAISARVGKLFHYGVPREIGTGGLDDVPSWDITVNPRGIDREIHDAIFSLLPGDFGGVVSWLAAPGDDGEHTDGLVATEAIRLLERFKERGESFFLAVGFFRPHTPFVAPKKWFDLHPLEEIDLPALSADDRSRTPPNAYVSARREQDTMTDDRRRQAIQAYRASVSFMDAQVGRVLDALDRLGFASDTIVVFLSDHGYHLADHGLWQKQSLFENSTRVPLVIAVPDSSQKGGVAKSAVELIDLYPTLAELAGHEAPASLEGHSLVPLLENPSIDAGRPAFSQVTRGDVTGYAVRHGKWRFIRYQNGDELLFDEEADPMESNNIADDPARSGTVVELRGMLEKIAADHPQK